MKSVTVSGFVTSVQDVGSADEPAIADFAFAVSGRVDDNNKKTGRLILYRTSTPRRAFSMQASNVSFVGSNEAEVAGMFLYKGSLAKLTFNIKQAEVKGNPNPSAFISWTITDPVSGEVFEASGREPFNLSIDPEGVQFAVTTPGTTP